MSILLKSLGLRSTRLCQGFAGLGFRDVGVWSFGVSPHWSFGFQVAFTGLGFGALLGGVRPKVSL